MFSRNRETLRADMAAGNSGTCLEFHTSQRAPDHKGCVQPPISERDSLPGQLRSCVVEQTTYLRGDQQREFFSTKDVPKRKRVNRIAKLKQRKVDARREQWLSQGNRCRPEQNKQVAQNFSRKEEKQVKREKLKAGNLASSKELQCRLHGVVIGQLLNDENISANKEDAKFSPNPYVLEAVEGHSKPMPTLKLGQSGRPELSIGASEDDSCENKRSPADPGRAARDSEETRRKTTNHQVCCEARGSIHCGTSCYIPDLVCFRADNTERSSGSVISRLGLVPYGPKLYDGKGVVVSVKNGQRSGCRSQGGTDQLCRSGSPCTSSSSVEIGSDDSDLTFSHETEDDWEVTADALYVPGSSLMKDTSQLPKLTTERKEFIEQKDKAPGSSNLQTDILSPEYKCSAAEFGTKSRGVGRAWRPDDVSRPPTLPRLSEQLSCESGTSVWSGLQQGRNVWGPPPVPTYCPICTEELDFTDSSFVPCSCGFRLCLFCHHRISSDDGRCPGCRKIYSADIAKKLSRTPFLLRV